MSIVNAEEVKTIVWWYFWCKYKVLKKKSQYKSYPFCTDLQGQGNGIYDQCRKGDSSYKVWRKRCILQMDVWSKNVGSMRHNISSKAKMSSSCATGRCREIYTIISDEYFWTTWKVDRMHFKAQVPCSLEFKWTFCKERSIFQQKWIELLTSNCIHSTSSIEVSVQTS